MATQARGLIRDQNLSVHFDVAPLGVKTNVSKSQKNGGRLGERKKLRKALSELPNSGKPYARQSSNDSHSKKMGAVVKEFDISEELLEHNHQECIKVLEERPWKDIDIDDFLPHFVLENYNTVQLSSKARQEFIGDLLARSIIDEEREQKPLKADSPPSSLERDEMYDFLGLDEFMGLSYGPVDRHQLVKVQNHPEPCAKKSRKSLIVYE